MARRVEQLVAAQLGRRPRGLRGVAVWCPFGFPAVIETRPYLEDGTPFPTLLYLTCPSAVLLVSRREGEEGVQWLRRAIARDPRLARGLHRLEEAYRRRRRLVGEGVSGRDGGAVFAGGIGGVEDVGRLSCLHALAAALLAGVDDWPGLMGPGAEDRSAGAGADVVDPCGVEDRESWQGILADLGELWCAAAACSAFVPAFPDGDPEAEPAPTAPEGERRATVERATPVGRVAAIDVGTMSSRLLVADMVDGRPVDVVRRAVITRLGESLGAEGRLLPDARLRTTHAVAAFVAQARALGAAGITLVGTSAVRDALDGQSFLHELGHALGVPALVASGELEARLAYAGATLDVSGDPVLLDIGGGSTELVHRRSSGNLLTVSLQLGSVRSTERWVRHDPPLPEELAAVRREAEELIGPFAQGFAATRYPGDDVARSTLVGVAGTVTTLACFNQRLEVYDPRFIHLTTITTEELDRHIHGLGCLSASERLAASCMQEGRELVILAGAEILRAVLTVLGFDRIVVSERDLLDGIVLHTPELQVETLTSL